MVDGPTDESGDGGTADEGKILTPQELDITESEYVEEIDDGRYVVSPETRGGQPQSGSQAGGQGGGQQGGSRARGGQPQGGTQGGTARGRQQGSGRLSGNAGTQPSASSGHNQRGRGNSGGELNEETVRRWLRNKYNRSDAKYAFDVTAQFDGTVSQRRMASNDLIPVFESLMLWYAQQVDSSMPVEEVLGILLMESNVPVRYPPESVRNLVKSTDLGPNDTIADLLEAVQQRDGVQL